MRTTALVAAASILAGGNALASSLSVAYSSMERLIVKHYLTDGGRRYLRGTPEDTCGFAFIQEPRVSSSGNRLAIRFLFAGNAGKEVAGKCVGAGDNFDIIVSGVPRESGGDLILDEADFEAEHKLFELFSPLVRGQIEPLLRVTVDAILKSYLGQFSSAGAGTVALESFAVESIVLEAESAVIDAELAVSVQP